MSITSDEVTGNVIRHTKVLSELSELYGKKNHDYGDSFHDSFTDWGLLMAAIRIGDKYNRFKTLIRAEQNVKDESVRDTLIDLANYAIMTVMEMDRADRIPTVQAKNIREAETHNNRSVQFKSAEA